MRDSEFYREIEHAEVPWGERSIHVPVFYYDNLSLTALFLAPAEGLQALLPSPRMHPLRVTPGQGVLVLATYQFRDSDLGPYNEVAINIPFTLDKPTPLFTGILRKGPKEPWSYIHHLPVTTQIAMDAGVEFAGYPKFLAAIEFESESGWTACRLAEGERHILTLAGRKLKLQEAPRSRSHAFTVRNGRLLRSEIISSRRGVGASRSSADVRLELGDHPIAQELRALELGRMLGYQYVPQYQTILTPVIESLAA